MSEHVTDGSDEQVRMVAGQLSYLRWEISRYRTSPFWIAHQVWHLMSLCLSGGVRAVARRGYWTLGGRLGRWLREDSDIALIAASGLFDDGYYRDANPDTASYAGTALEHFVRHGAAEGRRPAEWFDSVFYAREYPDVPADRRNVFAHFIQYGMAEGRLPRRRFSYAATMRPTAGAAGITLEPDAFANAQRWYDERTPTVSIIILNWNKSDLTVRCLTELWRHTTGHPYEIIVLDNGSRPEDIGRLQSLEGRFRLIRLPTNRFFGEGNNIAAEQARGRFVLFLNNDAFATGQWLEPLMAVFARHPDAGVVGPKFVYPDGRLQEAGAMVDEHGLATQFGKGGDPNDPRFAAPTEVQYCSAACILLRRETFDRVLGFDLMWDPAYYEDADLCLKIAQLGLKTYYCPASTIIHIENATSADGGRELRLDNIVAINRTKFVQRWGGFLGGTQPAPKLARVPFPVRAPATSRRRVGLYTPYDILPGGGEMYLLSVAATLAATNEVTVVSQAPYSRLRLLTMARELNLDLDSVGIACLDTVTEAEPFDLFIAMGNEILPPLRGLGRRNLYMCQFPFPLGATEAQRRREFWTDYESVVVNSPFTRDHATAAMAKLLLTHRPVRVVAPPVQLIAGGHAKTANLIIGVGRFFVGGHCKRHDIMIIAFREFLKTTGIDAELHLAGALHPQPHHRDYLLHLQDLAEGLPVVFHLNAGRDELTGLYRRASVYWHAAGFDIDPLTEPEKCEHFGITVVEAMSAGCIPMVPDRGGPAALVQPGESGFHYATAKELVSLTAKVFAARGLPWVGAMAAAARHGARDYDQAHFRRQWLDLADSANG